MDLTGSDFHYNVFESFLSGRSLYAKEDDGGESNEMEAPSDQFRRIFKAQLLKDEAMAHRVTELLRDADSNVKFLVIAGNGHMKHYCGVPERVLRDTQKLSPSDTCLVISESTTAQSIDKPRADGA